MKQFTTHPRSGHASNLYVKKLHWAKAKVALVAVTIRSAINPHAKLTTTLSIEEAQQLYEWLGEIIEKNCPKEKAVKRGYTTPSGW